MNANDLAADLYRQQAGMLQFHLADFTDAEMLVRPAETANHAAWQLGHLAVAFEGLINAGMPDSIPLSPPEMRERFGKQGAKLNDGFPSKAELFKAYNEANERAIKWVLGLSDADKLRPMPEKLQGFAKTVGHLVYAIPNHTMMHVGQFQVIRRKLGKPILF